MTRIGYLDVPQVLVVNNLSNPQSALYLYSRELKSAYSISRNVDVLFERKPKIPGTNEWCFTGTAFPRINTILRGIVYRKAIKFLRRSLDEGNVVHYAFEGIPPLTQLNDRTIVSFHDNPFSAFGTRFYSPPKWDVLQRLKNRFFSPKMYKYCPNLIVHSDYVRRGLHRYGFVGKIRVVHEAVNHNFKPLRDKLEIRKRFGLALDKKLVLSVSRLEERKNINRAYKAVKTLGNDFQMVRVGDPIEGCINFNRLGFSDLNEIYNACDIMLMPSIEEGFGRPVIEAFAAGTPVVASSIEVFKEISGDAAIFVDPFSIDSIAGGILKALDMKEDLISKGSKRAQLYTFETFKRNLNDVLSEITQ